MIKQGTIVAILSSLCFSQTASAESLQSSSGVDNETVALESFTEEAEAFKVNVTSNPFYLLFGGVQAAASFRLDSQLAAGPTLSTMSILGSRFLSAGVQGQYHLQDKDVMSGGLILDSSLELTRYSYSDGFGNSESDTGLLATSAVQWQWFYGNGFNMRAGLGLAANFSSAVGDASVVGSSVLLDSGNLVVHAYIDGKIAWAF